MNKTSSKSILLAPIDFFIPTQLKQSKQITELEALRKARLVVGISMVTSAMAILMFFVRISIEGMVNPSLYTVLAGGVVVGLCPLVGKYTGNFKFGSYAIMFAMITVIPLRVYATGGLSSSVAAWLTMIPAVGMILFGRRVGIFMTLYTIFCIWGIGKLATMGIKAPYVEVSDTVRFAVLAIIFGVIGLVLYTFESERMGFVKAIKFNEEQKTIASMLVTLNHEINNPLAIALGRVKLALMTKDPKQIQSAYEALVRVAKIIEKMNEIKSGDDSKEIYRISSVQTSTEDENESSTMYKVG